MAMLQRISSMTTAELMVRARQEISKRLERSGMIGGHSAPGAGKQSRILFHRRHMLADARFFRGAVSASVCSLLNIRMPIARTQILAAADDICLGRFNLLGYQRLYCGDPPDWHLDPVSRRRAPLLHWSRIDPLDAGSIGDSKLIWELSRHQWFIHLGQAYRYTGDERYAEKFAVSIQGWLNANPPGMGINWTSSLEVAFRLIAWSWALFLLRESKALSATLVGEIIGSIRIHARHIERYLSYYFSPNTHLTGEALGLFYAGVIFPELEGASRWRTLGRRILLEQLDRQIFKDGVYFEQSTCYQRYTVEIYLHFLILAARHGVDVPAAVGEKVQQMLDFLLTLNRPDGSLSQIGDADGGSLLPLVRRKTEDCRGVFAVAATFFHRSDYAWAAGAVTPEVLWLLGPSSLKAFDSLLPAPPAMPASRLFAQGGYAVMRNDWDRHAHRLIFDVGPLGCPVSAGHGHADLLSIQCDLFGEPCLVDPGTHCYTADSEWRDYFRSTAAHNTITVDGLNQAVPDGPFKWRQRPSARLRRWVSTANFDLADAYHDAYEILPDPVTHRRRVLFVKPRYWVIVDDLAGNAEHRIDLRFQFAPMKVTFNSDGWVVGRKSTGQECRLLVSATAVLQSKLVQGNPEPAQGWIAPDYGRREPAPMLIYSTETRLPLRIVSLLFPADNPFNASPAVAVSMGHSRLNIVFKDKLETIHIGEQDIVIENSKRRKPL
ncbi:MAG TPA: alginate lyase family protein [Gammaproteobacteria bacterium]